MSATKAAVATRPPERACRLVEWKPWPYENPHLIGHATVSFSGWVVHRIPVFRKGDGGYSVGGPNAAEIDSDGRIKERDGKRQYWPIITFESQDAKERWQRAVLAALAAGGIVS